jgi:hypothetical protein
MYIIICTNFISEPWHKYYSFYLKLRESLSIKKEGGDMPDFNTGGTFITHSFDAYDITVYE